MEYVKTFILLAIFIILAVGNIANIIRHHKENKEDREAKKEAKRKAKMERKGRGLFFWRNKKPSETSHTDIVREYDLVEEDEEYDETL